MNGTLSIFGEQGSVVIGGLMANKVETWRFADSDTVEATNDQEPDTVYGFGHSVLFKDFVESIEADREPAVSGEDGKKALEIILAIYKSQKTGKPVVLPCDFSTLEMEGYFNAYKRV